VADRVDAGESADVVVSTTDGVAVITLNRPDRLNVFTGGMGRLLSDAFTRCDADDDIRAIVVTGAGRAFCAGADMTPEADSFGPVSDGFSASPIDPPAWELRKPVIAAVNGHAIGIGFTIAMQCDIRYVAADAKLAIAQVRRGAIGDACSHWTVPHATSLAVAADILLTGRTFLGEEAARLGLVSRALPAGEVLPEAMSTAVDIARNTAPLSVALSKRLLWKDAGIDEVRDLETLYHRLIFGGDDAREGPRAWMERRPPRWTTSINAEWNRVLEAERARSDGS
jgi:enoyl-CoA hydratase/carnithine racemase